MGRHQTARPSRSSPAWKLRLEPTGPQLQTCNEYKEEEHEGDQTHTQGKIGPSISQRNASASTTGLGRFA
jgi:hypothetical protein